MGQWDEIAKEYSTGILSQDRILFPNLTKLNLEGNLLDIGCGSGDYSRFFSEKGLEVCAIDSSPEQIELAKRTNAGPEYQAKGIEEFSSEIKYNTLFANMLICNLENEEKLNSFFKNSLNLANANSTLYLTNVSSQFQRTCSNQYLSHKYSSNEEGSQFQIMLHKSSEPSLEFTNTHWSESKVIETAKKNGWTLEKSTKLNAANENLDLYTLYEFRN